MGHGFQIFSDNFFRQGGYSGNGLAIYGTDILGEAIVFREALGKPVIRGLEEGRSLDGIFHEIDGNMEQLGIQWKTGNSGRSTTVTVTVNEAQAGATASHNSDNDRDEDVSVEVLPGEDANDGNGLRSQVVRQNGRPVGLKDPSDGKVYSIFTYPDFLRFLEEEAERLDRSYFTHDMTANDLISAANEYYGGRELQQMGFSSQDVRQEAETFLKDNKDLHDNWNMTGDPFMNYDDRGLSREDVSHMRQVRETNATSIDDPKFIKFLLDQYEGGNKDVYADGLNGSINETDMQKAIQLWNRTYGQHHGIISDKKKDFDNSFESMANAYDNFMSIDDNVEAIDLRERLRHLNPERYNYKTGPSG